MFDLPSNACHFRFSGEPLVIDYIAYVYFREYTMYGTKVCMYIMYVHQSLMAASNGWLFMVHN